MRFHLVHIVADARFHGLFGYQEVIDTLQWGLSELGYEVSTSRNSVRSDARNLVLGGQLLHEHNLDDFPPDTIFYNLEQLAGVPQDQLKPILHPIAKRFTVWEYSERNLSVWSGFQPAHEVVAVPIGFAPVLRRIQKRQQEDIDVLFYGMPSDNRLLAFESLCALGMRCVYACGLYGISRDELIARSKLVLNINLYAQSRIFEVVRVSYLLANEKAVVSEVHPDTFIEPDLREAIALAELEQVPAACEALVTDDAARRALEMMGAAVFARRDIREILRSALTRSRATGR